MALTDNLKIALASTADTVKSFQTNMGEVIKVAAPQVRTSENMKAYAYFWGIGSGSVASRADAYNGTASNGPVNTVGEISLTSAGYSDFELGRQPSPEFVTDSINTGVQSILGAVESYIWSGIATGVTASSATSGVLGSLSALNTAVNGKIQASKLVSNWTLLLSPVYYSTVQNMFITAGIAVPFAQFFDFRIEKCAYLPTGVNGLLIHKGAAVVATTYLPDDDYTFTAISPIQLPFTVTEYEAGVHKQKLNLASEFGFALNGDINNLALKLV